LLVFSGELELCGATWTPAGRRPATTLLYNRMVFAMGYGKVAQLTLMEVGFAMDFLERQFLIGKSAVSSVRRKTQIR